MKLSQTSSHRSPRKFRTSRGSVRQGCILYVYIIIHSKELTSFVADVCSGVNACRRSLMSSRADKYRLVVIPANVEGAFALEYTHVTEIVAIFVDLVIMACAFFWTSASVILLRRVYHALLLGIVVCFPTNVFPQMGPGWDLFCPVASKQVYIRVYNPENVCFSTPKRVLMYINVHI